TASLRRALSSQLNGGGWGREEREPRRGESPQCNYCIAVTGGASNALRRWGPDACWGAAAGSHHFSPPLSLV
ncbi:hypothetical protein ABVT39_023137, partial [Epinephelus coioides]